MMRIIKIYIKTGDSDLLCVMVTETYFLHNFDIFSTKKKKKKKNTEQNLTKLDQQMTHTKLFEIYVIGSCK